MDKIVINGGKALEGEVEIQSAKNSVLCLLSCCLLSSEKITIHKCPIISDVLNMIEILKSIGAKVEYNGNSVTIDSSNLSTHIVPETYTKAMRSSIFLLGPLVARLNMAELSYPGGCDIGLRPIDLHLKGLKILGVETEDRGGILVAKSNGLVGDIVQLDYPSVGATENIIMTAVLAKGKTIIKNAAKEPEIIDLQNFINKMGGKVYGAGTSTILIEGVKQLHGGEFTPISDRIVAGTYLIAGAITGGKIMISNAQEEHIYSLIVKLRESACKIRVFHDNIYIEAPKVPKSVSIIETSPYPGFPTDLQAQMLALQTISSGTCILQENLFETRFKHVGELMKMGANITLRGRLAIIQGVDKLIGSKIVSHDLRGGASLVLAGLKAEGQTVIEDIYHIQRGYVDIVEDLVKLGANIKYDK